jgi:hypothetical protein
MRARANAESLPGSLGQCTSSGARPTCRHPHAILRRAVGHRRACASLVASFAVGGLWVMGFGLRASVGRVAANASTFAPCDPVGDARAQSSALPCQREAGARTDNNAVFTPRADANAHRHPDVVRYVIDGRARPWLRRSPRAFRCRTLGGGYAATLLRALRAHRHLPSRCARALRRARR